MMSCEFCRCQPHESVHSLGCPDNISDHRQRRDATLEYECGFRDAMDGMCHTQQGDSYLLGYSRGQASVALLQKQLKMFDRDEPGNRQSADGDRVSFLDDIDVDEFLDDILGPVSGS